MKLKAPGAFKYKKLLNPCRKILQIFKFKFKRPLFIRPLWLRRHQPEANRKTRPRRKLATGLLSLFGSLRRSREMDRLMALKSFSDAGQAPFPSPLTPAYVRMSGAHDGKEVSVQEDVDDACRSFENYLVEMIVEEGKVRDLMDVEELLHCWKNLKCPVFMGLVCRFYGELCKDLFSNTEENINTP